jgi:hypothetical protein
VREPTQGGTPLTPPPDVEIRGVPNEQLLWKGTDLMRFAHFPTINSVSSMRVISNFSHAT